TKLGKRCCEHGAAAPAEDEPERAEELGGQFRTHCDGLPLPITAILSPRRLRGIARLVRCRPGLRKSQGARFGTVQVPVGRPGPLRSMTERIDPDYRSLFEQLPGSFLVVRADPAFTIVEANDAYLQATFTTRESIVGRGLFDVLPKEPVATRGPAGAKLRRSLENVIATGRRDPMPVQRF